MVHFDWSGHFGRSDRNVPLHLTKLLSLVLLFCILLTRTLTCCGLGWVCATGVYHSIGHVELMKNFKLEFLLNGIKHPRTPLSHLQHQHSVYPGINATCNENKRSKQESPKGNFNWPWAANFPGGGGGCTLRPSGISLTIA